MHPIAPTRRGKPTATDAVAPLQIHISEAARLLSYDSRTIRRLITRGELQAVGRGKLRRVLTRSVHEYQQRNLS
jgi:excisionase family DNA binding protein